MRKNYDFSKGIKNPYYDMLTKEISVAFDDETFEYFSKMESDTGIEVARLAKFFLSDCARKKLKPSVSFS